MVKEYQELNPSNARIDIDYEKDKVDMEYVHHQSAFKTCHEVFSYPILMFHAVLFVIIAGIYIFSNSLTELLSNSNNSNIIVTDGLLIGLSCFLLFLIWFIGLKLVMAFAFSKNPYLLKKMPNLSYKFSSGKPTIAEFNPEDVVDNKCEIPLFSNVGLDYQATKEFSKYLIRVKIVEHGFNDLIKGKKKLNPYLWKAIFYFKQKPTTGTLEVKFK